MCCSRRISFMAKSELFKDHGRLAGTFLSLCGAFPVNRNSADKASMDTAADILLSGGVVGIFPQGGIVSDAYCFEPKCGAAFLSVKTGVPMIPAAIKYSRGRKLFSKITVTFCRPVYPAGENLRGIRTLTRKLRDSVLDTLEEYK